MAAGYNPLIRLLRACSNAAEPTGFAMFPTAGFQLCRTPPQVHLLIPVMLPRRSLVLLLVSTLIPILCHASPSASSWREDFSGGMDQWWSEGGERVWVEGGRMRMWADDLKHPGGNVATAWSERPLPVDFELEVDAHVDSSSLGVNNINLFFSYTDPNGTPLKQTRDSRKSAAYNLYHQLNGYIITFVREEGKARMRIRRNPGFVLLAESRDGESDAGVTYTLNVRKQNGEIIFRINGREMVRAKDPKPWGEGLLGLRTFRTQLWWDNVRVRDLAVK
jgi:hypothetical protein